MVKQVVEESCETCRFWNCVDDDEMELGLGQCRKRAPVFCFEINGVRDSIFMNTHFPMTEHDAWCGEYEAK